MAKVKQANISEKAYVLLSRHILTQQLKPGEKLREEQLAQKLGISRTPLRDAINRLGNEGFVEMTPRKGASVKKYHIEDVIEVYDIRIALEGLATKLATPHVEKKELKRLSKLFKLKNVDTLLKADMKLHNYIISRCGNKKLVKILDNIQTLVQVFRVMGCTSQERAKKATEDHNAILKALIDRKASTAEQAMKRHIVNTKHSILIEYKQNNGMD